MGRIEIRPGVKIQYPMKNHNNIKKLVLDRQYHFEGYFNKR